MYMFFSFGSPEIPPALWATGGLEVVAQLTAQTFSNFVYPYTPREGVYPSLYPSPWTWNPPV